MVGAPWNACSKFFFEIVGAIRVGGGEVESNARLASVLERARAAAMPKENIQKAIRKVGGGVERRKSNNTYPLGDGSLDVSRLCGPHTHTHCPLSVLQLS